MRANQDKDLKGKDKDFQGIYKSRESACEAMAFADTKRLVAEHALVEAEAVRDKALTKAASLESMRKRLAQSVVDNVDMMLG